MALSITNNIASLIAQQNLGKSSSALTTSLQRLSSGLKINSGADGPAALVISNEQGAQIAGLQSAVENTNQAVSLVQTAEGALGEVNNLLVQIRGLALSAANSAVNDPTALAADQAQIQNALQTIDRISQNTQFGTKKLLDGTSAAQVTIGATGAANIASVTAGASTVAGTYQIAVSQLGKAAQVLGGSFNGATNSATTVTGTALAGNATITNGVNTAQVGTYTISTVTQGVKGTTGALTAADLAAAQTQTLTISGGLLTSPLTVNQAASTNVAGQAAAIQAALNTAAGSFTGAYTVTNTANSITITSNVFAGQLTVTAAAGGGGNGIAAGTYNDNGVATQVQLSGGNLTSPVTLTADAATNTTTNNGARFTVGSSAAAGLQFQLTSGGTTTAGVGTSGSVTVAGSDTLTLNGTAIALSNDNANNITNAINAINGFTATTGVKASNDGSGRLVLTATKLGGGNFTLSETGGNIGITNTTAFSQNAQDLQAKLYDVNGNQLGGTVTGSGPGGNVITANGTSFGNANGISFTLNYGSATVNGVANTQSVPVPAAGQYTGSATIADALVFQIGANANQTASLSIQNTSSSNLAKNVAGLNNVNTSSLSKIDVTTTKGANDALKIIDQAINDVSSIRGNLGAFQTNTLQATAINLQTTLTNTTAAQSVIRDTDFAAETANFTKNQVLVQAGTTVLTNANATAQLVLNLLK